MSRRHSHPTVPSAILVLNLLTASTSSAQFIDDFNGGRLERDARGVNGWTFFTGDGCATMDFFATGKGYASVTVDATKDTLGIWWALIKRRVSKDMDLSLLRDPRYAFRLQTRVRVSEAPRRVNLHLNTQRTSDFHSHLMEFDIPDTARWHTISMTTHGFDAIPGDSVYAQLALMDWGPERSRVDVDYFKVDVVEIDTCPPDRGTQVPYHPPVVEPSGFARHIPVAEDCTIDRAYPDLNFNDWSCGDDSEKTVLLAVGGTQFVVLRWNLAAFAGQRVAGPGTLALTTFGLQRSPRYQKDFGMVRVAEIIAGDPAWNQTDVTCSSLTESMPLNRVVNSQMIIDVAVNATRDGRNYITISNPVLQRIIDGRTLGLAVRPLGAVHATFYAMENRGNDLSARLHFNLTTDLSQLRK